MNENDGFLLSCKRCGNSVELTEGFIRSEESIYLSTWMSLDIKCRLCDNTINESDD